MSTRRSTKAFLVAFLGALLLCAGLVVVLRMGVGSPSSPGGRQVLTLNLQGSLPDQDPSAAFNELLGVRLLTLPALVRTIDHAAADPSVAALELRVGPLAAGWARVQEVRDAVLRFRATGKPVHAFLEEADDGAYVLAAAADRVRLMPSSTLWLDGLSADVTFYGGTLGKVGVQADLEQIGPYKNAADVMKRSEMSEAHREAMTSLVDGLYREIVRAVATSLDAPEAKAEELVSSGPHAAPRALEMGLVDALGYQDESAQELDAALGAKLPRTSLLRYARHVPMPSGSAAVAVVYCTGSIASGESSDSLLGGSVMGSDTIVRALREAREEGVRAVVLRIDSPGGSATASDAIWRETMRTREAGIPVVVSMADVAASGGYWIAMGADEVVAEPSTITGSIGIYGGKYVLAGLNDLVGLHVEAIERGPNAGLMSSRQPFTPEQRAWLQGELHGVYRLFIERVASGRGFASPEEVDRIAQGRVWTGRQALENGLVDRLGGLDEALAVAKSLARLPEDSSVAIREFPRAPSLLEMLRDGGPQAVVGGAVRALAAHEVRDALPRGASPLLDEAGLARLLEGGVLAWTPVRILAR